jgi:hypothetical protein
MCVVLAAGACAMNWSPLTLATRSNPAKHKFEGNARLVNMYSEGLGQDAKNTVAVYATEGLDTWITPVLGKVWALQPTETMLYGVTGVTVWGIDLSGVVTIIGTLPIEGPVYMDRNRRNPTQVVLVTVENAQYRVIEGVIMTLVTTNSAGPPSSVVVHDGQVILSLNFNRYQQGAIDDATTFNALAVTKAERSPDEVLRVMALENDLVIFGTQSVEWHQNQPDGVSLATYVPVNHISIGLLSARAAVRLDRNLLWLASDGTVRQMIGYDGQVVSTPAVQRAIGMLSDPTEIYAFAWNSRSIGHSFVAFSCDKWTWVYDLTEGMWHERASYNRPNWRVSAMTEWNGRLLAGDDATGEIYDISGSLMDEAGDPVECICQTPPADSFPYAVPCHGVILDGIPGTGRVLVNQPQNSDPVVYMAYSDDGGQTFSAERSAPVGQAGGTNTRTKWLRLNLLRRNGRTFRFRTSARVVRGFQSAAVHWGTPNQG